MYTSRGAAPRKRVFGAVNVIAILVLTAVAANPQNEISAELERGYAMYAQTQPDEAIKIGSQLLKRRDLGPRDSIAVFELLCVSTYAKGLQYRQAALGYLTKMADVGPCLNQLPQDFWPRQLWDKWYHIKQARNILACPRKESPEIRTIAFLPFDNNSLGEYQESLGGLGRTLSEFLVYHFSLFSELEVVERNKMDYLLRESGLVRDSIVDASTAIQVGKLLGAHLMVFGSVTQFDKKNARLMARVVHVETGRIITPVIREGKPQFSKLEKELVEELAKELDLSLSKEAKRGLKKSGTESMDALYLYTKGLDAQDRYDYEEAYGFFKKAYELDSDFFEAKKKMDIYEPLLGERTSQG